MSTDYQEDIQKIMSHRHDFDADYWTTNDNRIIKGAPFSLLESVSYLLELGLSPKEPVLLAATELIFNVQQKEGRFKVYPGAVYPCQTTWAAMVLCQLGYQSDPRLEQTFQHLLDTQESDGGWRCEKYYFGRGPETSASNPLPTLYALDCLRHHHGALGLDKAIDFLLSHWETKLPLGPCHYGIGTLFMQVEYPFRGYNLFKYVHVLSFYESARKDPRFLEAFACLTDKLVNGQIVVERVVPKLAKLDFCRKGQPSHLATKRYQEIVTNLANDTKPGA